MENNLDKIAKDLYGKIQTRFPDITIGDENAQVLTKKSDIPRARFFEFEYKEDGNPLGTIAITLDEEDGVVVQISGELSQEVKTMHQNAYDFIRSFRKFAKTRLLNFDVQNIGKSNLDKRDYQFQAKPKITKIELPKESPIMENKMFGTSRISYQNLGEARLIVKHSQPINPNVAAGRSMHIESIYIENADGERFKYPYKHLHGARALAEHIKHGGNPYDAIGKHITGLSEELNQLKKFKNYVGRQDQISESMGSITNRVMERIEEVKKECQHLQRASYYEQFAESFEESKERMIPEEIKNDWIDRLTVRTFNEELTSAFPFLYKIIDESELPVIELDADAVLDEAFGKKGLQQQLNKAGFGDTAYWEKGKKEKAERHSKADAEMVQRDKEWKEKFGKKDESLNPELALESFLESIVNEDRNELFSPNPGARNRAIQNLNTLLAAELAGGTPGVLSLKGIIDDPALTARIQVLNTDAEIRKEIKDFILDRNPKLIPLLPELENDSPEEIGGGELSPPAESPAPEALPPTPEAVPPAGEVPPAPEAIPPAPGTMPSAPGVIPPQGQQPAPIAESVNRKAKVIAKFIKVKESGATLDTPFSEGMTLRDAIRECGLTPMECGYTEEESNTSESGIQQLKDVISGFWNDTEDNFTIGGTKAKIKVAKAFKDGECPKASESDLKHVLMLITSKDPSEPVHSPEQAHVIKLSGVKVDNREGNLLNNLQVMQEQPIAEGELALIKRNAGLL
jgi:hypothetical protein